MKKSRFWNSDILTGNQTDMDFESDLDLFWNSDILTGNQTKYQS